MLKKRSIRRYSRQILAFVEKNLYLEMRIKANLFLRFFNPIIQLLILIFIFGFIFNINKDYKIGYWNANNYILFLLIAFSVQFSKSIITKYDQLFIKEKYWKTLSAIMIAPVNRFTLLFGTLISEMIMISVPLLILFIIALILYPISLFYIFLVLLIYILMVILFGSIGLFIGAFSISNEEYVPYLRIILRLLFLFSCINYPKEIFPKIFQDIVLINPLYYLFDLLRLTWYLGIDNEIALSHISITHIIVIFLLTFCSLISSLFIFERVYKKYGITGY